MFYVLEEVVLSGKIIYTKFRNTIYRGVSGMREQKKSGYLPKLEVLSDSDRERIYSAALDVLEKTGLRIQDKDAISLLLNTGGKIKKDMVQISSRMVQEALDSAPKEIQIYNRDGQTAMLLNTKNSYFGNGSDCVFILDSFTGERRKFMKEDVEKAAIILDALENIDFVMPAGIISEKLSSVAGLLAFQATTVNTSKPILFTALNRQGAKDIFRLASIIAGGEDDLRKRPYIMHYVETTSPLSYSDDALQMLLLSAEKGVPIICAPGPIAGASAPTTLAGVLVLHLAESLSELVIAQLKNRGAPVIIGGCASIMDMRTTVSAYSGPEFFLLNAALTELCHFLNLPMFGTAGCSDSKKVDGQAAIESASSIITQLLCGADLIHDVGYIESGLTQSFDMMVMSNEIVGMAKRMKNGIKIDDDHIALDLIHELGAGGNYLAEEHTLKYFKTEFWMPGFMNRQIYESWAKDGKKGLEDLVKEKVKRILDEHRGSPIGEGKTREIISLLESRETLA